MNPISSDLGSAHVLNLMSQEQEITTPSSPGSRFVSDPGSTDQRDTMNQEQEDKFSSTSAHKSLSEPVSIDDLDGINQEHEINISSTPARSRSISELGSTNDLDGMNQEHGIDDASTPIQSPPHRRHLPCFDLINGSKEDYMNICLPLHEAAITSDWEAAKVIFDKRPELVRSAVTPQGDTTLHIAVSAEATKMAESFVENLVNMMEIKDLEIENYDGNYAFQIVVAKGSVKMFEVMLNKHQYLLNLSHEKTWWALLTSTGYGNHDMAWYLYNVPAQKMLGWFWTDTQQCMFFVNCVDGDMLDIALKVLSPKIATSIRTCRVSLYILAGRPDVLNRTEGVTWRITDPFFAFFHLKKGSPKMDNQALTLLKSILKLYPVSSQPDMLDGLGDTVFNVESEEKDMTNSKLIITAVETGNTRFVIELLRSIPQLIWSRNNDGLSIFHIAVIHRHIDIYNLLYEVGAQKDILATFKDKMNNNILHLVGMTSNNTQLQTVSGASLLMQRELLWFKEVEKITPANMRNLKNKDGRTPYELFSENNQELVSKGLKWTKDCMVVTTLIITIAFAAAFTVPGGYNQETGIPIFTREISFLVFIIADCVSLFSSSTSLLVFLSIITSPHGQRDFLYSLPRKLMIGLVTLFISVAAMMVTFAASFFVLYNNTFEWLPIFISIFAATPVIVFAALQYPLLTDMLRSMYDSRYLFKPKRRVLYNINRKL